MITMIAKVLKILNSEAEPFQISLALCFAMLIGLTPLLSLHNLFFLVLVLVLKVNLSAFILGFALFFGVAYLLDPLFHGIGLAVLTEGSLEGLWTTFYNITLLRFAYFNNTIVMGSLLFSLILFIPLFLVLNLFIRRYRDHILTKIQNTRIMQIFKASKFYHIYHKVSGWRGAS